MLAKLPIPTEPDSMKSVEKQYPFPTGKIHISLGPTYQEGSKIRISPRPVKKRPLPYTIGSVRYANRVGLLE